MDELNTFLQNQKILQIAPHAGDPWIANVFMMCEEADKIYFIGSKETLYGKKLIEDPKLAFATAWHAEGDHLDRKGIQGIGTAHPTADDAYIDTGVRLHNQNYPEFADRISPNWIKSTDNQSSVWVIEPTYIKFWNDALYGEDETKEFNF